MTKLQAGTRVSKGYYFNLGSWTLQPMSRDGDVLPGAAREKFMRVPTLLAFALAPVMGAAFLMFLPFVGFYLALQAGFRAISRLFTKSATEIAATMQPGWQPGAAHLTGKKSENEGGAEPAKDERIDDLANEIEQKRGGRKS
jgi:hypothetical protein